MTKKQVVVGCSIFVLLAALNFVPSDSIPRLDVTSGTFFHSSQNNSTSYPTDITGGLCPGVDTGDLYYQLYPWCSTPWAMKGFPLRLNSPDDNSVILPFAALDIGIDACAAIALAWIIYRLGSNKTTAKTGTFAGIPYDWRKPTMQRFLSRVWNPNAPFINPRWWGWGYDFNMYAVIHPVKWRNNRSKGAKELS